MVGNLVLADIVQRTGDKIAHRKGTTFTGRKSIYIGRYAKDDYLRKAQLLHLANVSPRQYQECAMEGSRQGKNLLYLFITAKHQLRTVDYWEVPGTVIGEFLHQLPVKVPERDCKIRIREENGKQYLDLEGSKATLKSQEVTKWHHEIPLTEGEAAAMQQAFQKPPVEEKAGDITAEQLMRLNKLVRDLGGVTTVRRALEILDNLKS
jgi:hypothetical protein